MPSISTVSTTSTTRSAGAVLAESHISIHTWPEAHYAAVDIFMCGRANPDACVPVLREAFTPGRVAVGEHLPGQGPSTRHARTCPGHPRLVAPSTRRLGWP